MTAIAKYTHAFHVLVDGLLGILLIAYATAASLGAILPANGAPAHAIIAIIGALLAASQALRVISNRLEQIDPGTDEDAGAIEPGAAG